MGKGKGANGRHEKTNVATNIKDALKIIIDALKID
jgi:hypothetical protein